MPPNRAKDGSPEPLLQQQKGTDHVVTHRHRLSLKRYPRDCPPVRPCWFHAVDIPKRRPRHADSAKSSDDKPEKPAANPKKYAAFSTGDSKAIEAAFQKMVEQEEANEETHGVQPMESQSRVNGDNSPNRKDSLTPGRVRVPVNEDYLFDVDVERRELGPAYWDGPVYDVRRGTWFYQDGSVQRPCDESLAAQLEEGYLKVRAWRLPTQSEARERARSESRPRERPASWTSETAKLKGATQLATQSSDRDLRSRAAETAARQTDVPSQTENTEPTQTTYRLFGSHMNTVVTYQDGKTAWLLTDDFMSRMSSTVYQRFAGGSHFAGVKLTRGYVDPKQKEKDDKDEKTAAEKTPTSSRDTSPPALSVKTDLTENPEQSLPSPSETRRIKLERQMSSLLEDPQPQNADKQEQERQRRERKEIEDDYRESEGDDQGREIEHLILVTHGIGQRLGLRIESVNFVHDVNTLRKTLKAVYADSPDLRALNAELGNAETVNSRIQVLPVCWRNLLRFPQQSVKHNRKEVDIAGDSDLEDLNFPSLEDITVEGVPAVRNLITDLALDILLYQSPAYKDHISRIVLSECNRIYHLFKERNPAFKGKISMVGHSLGSAIMFDLLCRQEQQLHPTKAGRREQREMRLDFPVEDFYALGSPIGLFQMLKGRNIVARQQLDTRKTSLSTSMDDPMLDTPPHSRSGKTSHTQFTDNDVPVSSPRCSQIFNIFHPTDPISYRLEPLISPAMALLKPQPLPYTKRGIFGAPMGQGLSGIGTRVSQSVSSMWSSMASSLLTRGLGYSEDSTSKYGNPQSNAKTNAPLSMGAGTNVAAGVVPSTMSDKKLEQLASQTIVAGETGQHPPTLIDSEIETLYAGYQKRRTSAQADSELRDLGAGAVKGTPEWTEAEERAKRLRREEEKVRRLNSNGRVDYAIQEGVFDINLIAAIASHLSYWSDEDVSHFIISQLLSRHRVVRNGANQNKRFT